MQIFPVSITSCMEWIFVPYRFPSYSPCSKKRAFLMSHSISLRVMKEYIWLSLSSTFGFLQTATANPLSTNQNQCLPSEGWDLGYLFIYLQLVAIKFYSETSHRGPEKDKKMNYQGEGSKDSTVALSSPKGKGMLRLATCVVAPEDSEQINPKGAQPLIPPHLIREEMIIDPLGRIFSTTLPLASFSISWSTLGSLPTSWAFTSLMMSPTWSRPCWSIMPPWRILAITSSPFSTRNLAVDLEVRLLQDAEQLFHCKTPVRERVELLEDVLDQLHVVVPHSLQLGLLKRLVGLGFNGCKTGVTSGSFSQHKCQYRVALTTGLSMMPLRKMRSRSLAVVELVLSLSVSKA
ncbi:hypothetical protein EYF80_015202 [Liparis tanakae]|uniref:Uncharacterized protein n=1 Tax=Liparis tanakae TaxID=230148 RepID=A0A4Z2IB43_9TELE|nr:hypothetical protein EYF80_015202 [Liparis tanakae]